MLIASNQKLFNFNRREGKMKEESKKEKIIFYCKFLITCLWS